MAQDLNLPGKVIGNLRHVVTHNSWKKKYEKSGPKNSR